MGLEEQKEEREVLESIFPDEIIDVSETEFRISIKLDDGRHEDDETEDEAPTIILNISYPPTYPDTAPNLDITQPPNASKHAHLDIHADKPTLLSSLAETITENLGMPMIFTLVAVLKESAELLMSERTAAQVALAEIAAAKVEEEENRKFQGEAVTRESFLRWREEYRAEMVEEERRRVEEREAEDKKRRVVREEKRLTGKELWVQGLVGKGEGEGDEDEDGEVDLQKLKISTVE